MANNQVAEQDSTFKTGLAKVSDTFYPMIEQQLTGNGIRMDDYQKTCVMNAIAGINTVLDTKGISWGSPELDRNTVTDILLKVAALKLNASASPREVYFQTRKTKKDVYTDGRKQEVWMKQIEMGIEGDGNDAILANFGRDVKTVHQFWLIREGDDFVYPRYKGIEVAPPEWTPKGSGKVIRVVYPITKINGEVEYYIAEREDVVRNLIAHAKQNMMNETFGIAQDRYKATPDQKKQIDAKKTEILRKIEELGLDAALADEDVATYFSPAWKDPQSRESMITRKMRNNVVKKIPKDFGNAFVSMTYDDAADDDYKRVRKEINENANQELLDFEPSAPDKNEANKGPSQIIDYGNEHSKEETNPEPEIIDSTQQTMDIRGTDGPSW